MSDERLVRPAPPRLTRRKLLIGLGVGAAAAPLSGCSFDAARPRRSTSWRRPRL